jgi:N-acetylglucosamine-6-phosphate deacetylase
MATRLCPASGLVLITDAINAAGLGPGKYQVWGFNMEVKDGAARLEDGTLAGSVLTLNRAVANMAQFSGLPLHQTAGMATHNPAHLLGLLPHAGVIAPGAAADLALFDKNMDCLATVIAGHPAHRADNSPL